MVELTATQALHRGVAAYKAGNLHEAERFYRAILRAQPKRPDIHHDIGIIAQAYCNLGVAQQHRGELAAAIGSYKQAIKIKPDYAEVFYIMGVALQQRGDLKAAIDSYKQAVNIKPDYTEVYYTMGLALRDKGELTASLRCYRQAVKIKPNDVDALNNLGAALQHSGELEAAIASYDKALGINSGRVEVYNNKGIALQTRGDLDAAIDCYKRALQLRPDYANAYNNLGHALRDKGDLRGAIECYKCALEINPDCAHTHNNLGNTLRDAEEYDDAIRHFDSITATETDPNNPLFWFNSKAQILECLYISGRYSELKERLGQLAKSDNINLRVAAVSAFASHQLKLEDPYPFCKKPLDYLHIGNLSEHCCEVSSFVENIIREAKQEKAVWEPIHGVTKGGFQTSNTIFKAGDNCTALENILRKEIKSYRSKFEHDDCEYMNSWPANFELRGWFSRLLKCGYQTAHNHPSGWLSGVIYLKTINAPDNDEGAIELGLHGHNLPILDDSYARRVHRPKVGDIVLFPSSLFHRTIPFSEDNERCVIAFDLYRYSQ